MGKKLWRHILFLSHLSVITGNILITIIRFSLYNLLLASNSTFTTDYRHLGTIQIRRNLNEHYYHLISTTSVIWQIDANCSLFKSLNMLPFHIRIRMLKINLLGLISNFSKYFFKTGTNGLLFLSSHVFNALEFDSNHFGILLWKIVKPRNHNEIKPPIGKIFWKYKPIRYYFAMSQKKLSCSFLNKVYDNFTRSPTSEGIKSAITWKPLFRRKSTFLSKLDLSEALTTFYIHVAETLIKRGLAAQIRFCGIM